MENFVLHLAHAAAWTFGIIFLLAIVGVIAIVRWIVNAFRRTEAAVEGGVRGIEDRFHRSDDSGTS